MCQFYVEFIAGVSFGLIKEHINESLMLWYQSGKRDKSCLTNFSGLLKSFIKVIKDDDQEEEIKIELINTLFNLHRELQMSHLEDKEMSDIFYKEVLDLPYEVLEKLADPFIENEFADANQLKTALKIRKNLAMYKQEYSLTALNSIIDHLAKDQFSEENDMPVNETLKEVFKVIKDGKQMKQWILEIMGQILFLIRQNCSIWSFNFMFEMFCLSVAALASREKNLQNLENFRNFADLPLTLTHLLGQEKFQDLGPQFAEWIMELMLKEQVSKFHVDTLKRSVKAVKWTEGYYESSIWGRLAIIE